MRITDEAVASELATVAIHHLERVETGIVSFGQGCEGEPLLRSTTMARAIEAIRAKRTNGTVNLNTNGTKAIALLVVLNGGLFLSHHLPMAGVHGPLEVNAGVASARAEASCARTQAQAETKCVRSQARMAAQEARNELRSALRQMTQARRQASHAAAMAPSSAQARTHTTMRDYVHCIVTSGMRSVAGGV